MGPQHGASKGTPLPLMRGDRVIETLDGEGQNAVTARYTSEAVAYIRENKDRPFFLYLPHTAVHVPLHPGSAFRGKSKYGTYGDWVEELDDSVGQVLSAVRDAGIDARTMVLFTSDNGAPRVGSNAPLRGFKASTWEGGMRVPTIVRWPGTVPAGVACNAVCGNIDILPSCLAIAGGAVAADRAIDGKNLVDLWRGSSTASPHAAYGCFLGNSLQGMRSGQWKYYTTENWLFDLDTDIAEAMDVAAAHPDVVATMRKYAEAIELDLGKGSVTGPGVRQAGRVASPVLPRLRP
jgi:arylsulfatase A-like enzyme